MDFNSPDTALDKGEVGSAATQLVDLHWNRCLHPDEVAAIMSSYICWSLAVNGPLHLPTQTQSSLLVICFYTLDLSGWKASPKVTVWWGGSEEDHGSTTNVAHGFLWSCQLWSGSPASSGEPQGVFSSSECFASGAYSAAKSELFLIQICLCKNCENKTPLTFVGLFPTDVLKGQSKSWLGSCLEVTGTDALFGKVTFLDTFRHIYKLTPMQKLLYAAHLSSVKVQTQGKGLEQQSAKPAQLNSERQEMQSLISLISCLHQIWRNANRYLRHC